MTNEVNKIKEDDKDFEKLIDKQVLRLKKDLTKHLPNNLDTTLLLLKGHLLIEYYLGILLILSDEDTDILNKTFFDKINKCRERKLLNEINIESIISLNKLRNKMAHELEYVISESDIDSIAMMFKKEYILEKMDNIEEDGANSVQKILKWFFQKNLSHILVKTIVRIDKEKKIISKE